MDIFCIRGGTPLPMHCAARRKNAALPLLAATLATGARCELLDCPDISDVTAACHSAPPRLRGGAARRDRCSRCRIRMPVRYSGRTHAENARCRPVPRAAARRFGTAELSLPGGCVLGARPIDLHLRGLRRMGAEITLDGEHISARTDGLHGCTVALPLPSVGATENLILGARLPGHADAVQRRA